MCTIKYNIKYNPKVYLIQKDATKNGGEKMQTTL